MSRLGNGTLEVKTRGMSDALHCKADTLRDHLRWLEQYKYFRNLEIGYGYARFDMTKPMLLLREFGYES